MINKHHPQPPTHHSFMMEHGGTFLPVVLTPVVQTAIAFLAYMANFDIIPSRSLSLSCTISQFPRGIGNRGSLPFFDLSSF